MIRSIVAIASLVVFMACGSDSDVVNELDPDSTQIAAADTTVNLDPPVDAAQSMDLLAVVHLDVSTWEMGDENEYGGGDCFGKVVKYSGPDKVFAIDSMSCGEYSSATTWYVLNQAGNIQAVYSKSVSATISEESDTYSYILKEELLDFTGASAVVMTKLDTVSAYADIEFEIDADFTVDTLEAWQATLDVKTNEMKALFEAELED